jgi:2-C-methyl-D-erythritol 4-phosphate cytidylyltransferase
MAKQEVTAFWLVLPAAGSSRRMGVSEKRKQYLQLAGRYVIDWALDPFLTHPGCRGAMVVLSAGDVYWSSTQHASNPLVSVAQGGSERAHSVLAGLDALRLRAQPRDWVLVHDAARPCLARGDLDRLLTELRDDDVGGLLAAPLVDTLKRSDEEGRVAETVPRTSLWRALTPQMFRYDSLQEALRGALAANVAATDEAQAIEMRGLSPKLIAGDPDNLKITTPSDFNRALRILSARAR